VTDGFGLDDAYSLQSTDDIRNLYRAWADTFDAEFIDEMGYVYHRHVVEIFLARSELPSGEVILDVGCGTGVGGVELRARGPWPVDGLDLSPEMLSKAAEKLDPTGAPVYRNLIEGDVLAPLDIADSSYGGLISIGTFTHGHVGPEAVEQLVPVVQPGGLICLGINEEHFAGQHFKRHFDDLVSSGRISQPDLTQVRIYDLDPGKHEHAADTALVASFFVEPIDRAGCPG
jgi:ubiquinone/menaquinone biosynthesis C-methylase UbiE